MPNKVSQQERQTDRQTDRLIGDLLVGDLEGSLGHLKLLPAELCLLSSSHLPPELRLNLLQLFLQLDTHYLAAPLSFSLLVYMVAELTKLHGIEILT